MRIDVGFCVLALVFIILLAVKGDKVKPNSDEAFGLWMFLGVGIMILALHIACSVILYLRSIGIIIKGSV